MTGQDKGIDSIDPAPEKAQEIRNDQKTQKTTPQDKREKVMPLKRLPTQPKQKASLEKSPCIRNESPT